MLTYFLVPALAWMTEQQVYEEENPGKPPLVEQETPPAAYPTGGLSTPSEEPAQANQTGADQQSIYWLSLVDQGQYPLSWLAGGSLLKDVIAQDMWASGIKSVRGPLGSVRIRKVTSHQKSKRLRYGTTGNFMVIQYDTTFSGGQGSHKETVTLMTEGRLKEWKVIGYAIGR